MTKFCADLIIFRTFAVAFERKKAKTRKACDTATKQDHYELLRFEAPASGTYLIKIGNYPARKVVVIRS